MRHARTGASPWASWLRFVVIVGVIAALADAAIRTAVPFFLDPTRLINDFNAFHLVGQMLWRGELALAYDVERIIVGGGVAAVGAPLERALRSALAASGAASGSALDLDLASRVRLAPSGVPFGALGAALAARQAVGAARR